MLLVKSTTETENHVVDVQGQSYVVRGYIGAAPVRGMYVDGNDDNDDGMPQGFHVTQPPGSVTRPHFHETDQFQVFVAGCGRFGKKSAGPLTVQFAAGHTPYGPIVAGEEGVQYFTLRKRWDPGAKYMPQMRDKFIRGRQRQALVANLPLSRPASLATRTEPAEQTLVGPEDDGLLAVLLRLGPNATAGSPDAIEGDGQYHVVVGGTLVHDGDDLPLWSCQFAFPDEGEVPITAGASGLEILILRFPKPES